MIEDKILNKGKLKIAVENVQAMSHEDYALVRKDYFGASDSSILCGVNLYKTMDDLIQEKTKKFITAEEKEVSEKAIVKKGYDIEPIILDKAQSELNTEVFKPKDMYTFLDTDGLSVNYDGVIDKDGVLIPVEAKLVSKYGEKYYNKTAMNNNLPTINEQTDTSLEKHIKKQALKIGIPAYYYTQVQQEIAGLDAPHGYLAAMFDDTWTFKLFYVPRDNYVIQCIKELCKQNIDKIKTTINK